ncbi:diguanylate cyclase [candidate division CSSED10-310 bacterium]|uniref:Diguanylate cyclase n=1 Tax=candidate division CSSED10-310 bacterium TaxID=2855610 RepID=A0ABV6Z1V5_UNCC1
MSPGNDDVRILVVEDDKDTLTILTSFLQKNNYTVYTALNGRDALYLLEEIIPDLIVCDIMMPKMDGFEFRNLIWNDPELQLVPFIYLSALSAPEDRFKGYELHADDYMVKPFDFEDLLIRIKAKLEKYQLYKNFVRYDALTRIFSRRFIMTLLNKELERVKRLERLVSISMIDIDNFKSINDLYGHPAGDAVLNDIAKVIQSTLRQYDFIGRYGGEEFLIVMPELNKRDAATAIDRIRVNLSKQKITTYNLSVTFSAGVAAAPEDGTEMKSLIYKADKALYSAKKLGKNRVELY